MAMSNPPGQAGPWSKSLRNNVHSWIGDRGKKFPCGGYPKGPVTEYRAGQVIPVRFWTFGVADYKKFPPTIKGGDQARHGGGYCEFSLSYDGGKQWKVIGQYTRTCPDIFYEWPVLIPKNAPSCTDSNKCLFSFSWVAFSVNQFYHHCANVIIHGVKNGKLPTLDMTVQDLKDPRRVHAEGDRKKGKGRGSGPDPSEVRLNRNGFFANGGGAGKKGLDLRLRGPNGRPL
ncbi:hypothetical protein BGZ75_005372 [Mortierella antarctica]|nr:hypothetical protein BGZ67_002097 [Mortierella alpina]KAF9989693.1 hypothetical protein BGZ75_005372 [Mortierella antarctica]